ncbi:hemocyanin A chain [Trichonephila inaurata madagascariensis]|uniref:Hemocyanin A chain n=1 Tax=Trichonephila inaurata madagascariensis TaxID=2747483 RepID=A0A8X6YGZ9_9ARAC|nr:hemocyanin A chain [Trichonephila inaurata madagascariensis]
MYNISPNSLQSFLHIKLLLTSLVSCKVRLCLVVKNRSQVKMSLFHEKQVRVLKLFEHISVASSGEQIPADQIDPRLLTVGELPNSAFFNAFLPEHLDETRRLIAIFYSECLLSCL